MQTAALSHLLISSEPLLDASHGLLVVRNLLGVEVIQPKAFQDPACDICIAPVASHKVGCVCIFHADNPIDPIQPRDAIVNAARPIEEGQDVVILGKHVDHTTQNNTPKKQPKKTNNKNQQTQKHHKHHQAK